MKSFTLIELLLTIAIFLIIGSFSTPFLSRFLVSQNVSQTTNQIKSYLKKAQSYSLSGKSNSNWGVVIISGELILFKGNSYVNRDSSFNEKTLISQNVLITGFSEIVFNRVTGVPDKELMITVSNQGKTNQITVNNRGMVEQL